MKPCLTAFLLISVASVVAGGTAFAAPSACAGRAFVEAQSLSALPAPVARLLGRDRPGLEGIADKGAPFTVTDAVSTPLPAKRFVLAAVNQDCVIVALEVGGIAHYFSLHAFERTNQTWRDTDLGVIPKAPHTLKELLDLVPR